MISTGISSSRAACPARGCVARATPREQGVKGVAVGLASAALLVTSAATAPALANVLPVAVENQTDKVSSVIKKQMVPAILNDNKLEQKASDFADKAESKVEGDVNFAKSVANKPGDKVDKDISSAKNAADDAAGKVSDKVKSDINQAQQSAKSLAEDVKAAVK